MKEITFPKETKFTMDSDYSELSGMKTLTKVTFSEGITEIPYSICEGCTNLKEVYLPSSIERIFDYAFYGCKSLNHINIPNESIYIGEEAFIKNILSNMKVE